MIFQVSINSNGIGCILILESLPPFLKAIALELICCSADLISEMSRLLKL